MDVVNTWEALLAWPADRIVFTIGNFDGLHLGHMRVLERAHEMALKNRAKLCVLTFMVNTRTVVGTPPKRLMQNGHRLRKLEAHGAACCAEIPFTASFSEMEAHTFLEALCGGRSWFGLVVGDDFAFGRGRSGNPDTLRGFTASRAGAIAIVPELTIQGERVSSSRIRSLLAEGRVETANALLGYHYSSTGLRVAGESIGRTIGYPTVNLGGITTLVPQVGVYQTQTVLQDGVVRPSMTYIGTRPTLDGSKQVVETHLLDFEGYVAPGEPVDIIWKRFIREDRKFDGLVALQEQLRLDEAAARGA